MDGNGVSWVRCQVGVVVGVGFESDFGQGVVILVRGKVDCLDVVEIVVNLVFYFFVGEVEVVDQCFEMLWWLVIVVYQCLWLVGIDVFVVESIFVLVEINCWVVVIVGDYYVLWVCWQVVVVVGVMVDEQCFGECLGWLDFGFGVWLIVQEIMVVGVDYEISFICFVLFC